MGPLISPSSKMAAVPPPPPVPPATAPSTLTTAALQTKGAQATPAKNPTISGEVGSPTSSMWGM